MEPDQQGEKVLGHVVRIGAHQLLTVGHCLFDNAAELGEDRLAQHATDTREPGRRLEEVHRVDPAHGRQEPVDIAGEFFLAAGHLAGKQRRREDVESQFGHVDGNVAHFGIVGRLLVTAGESP